MFPRRMALLEVRKSCRLQEDLPLNMARCLFGESVPSDLDVYLKLLVFVFVFVVGLHCQVVAVLGSRSAG